MTSEEKFVIDFLEGKSLQAIEFTKEEKLKSKTPDFRVFKENELVFFCEVKTSCDDWLDKQLNKAPSGEIVGGLRNDPIFNRLSNKIHEAVQQFDAVNPNLKYPNVLVFVNHDRACDVNDLKAATNGNFSAEGGKQYPIYKQFSEGRIREEKFHIHLYIWLDYNGRSTKKPHYHFNLSTQKEKLALCNYFSINPQKII